MTFSYPWVLLLLAAPLLTGFWVWARRGRRVVLPFDHGLPGTARVTRAVIQSGETLPSLVLAIAILLLAGPQQLAAPKLKRSLTNIEFCLDVSGSMTAPFGNGDRYDAAMGAINDFITYREGDAFGLTFFGNQVLHWVPLTTDPSAFQCATPFMGPRRNIPGFGGTEIGKALLACRDVLISREEGDRMIILVSDGFSADLGGQRDQEVVRKMKQDGITVYGIHISNTRIPEPIVTITAATGGEVFNPGDPQALQKVFKRIDEMQETKLEKAAAEYVDWFWPFCVAGLSVLGLYLLMLLGLRYTPW